MVIFFDSSIDESSEMEKKEECIFQIFLSTFFPSRISIFVVSYPTELYLVFYTLFI